MKVPPCEQTLEAVSHVESLPEARLPHTHFPSDSLVNNDTRAVIMVTSLFKKNLPTKSCHCFVVACVNMILFIVFLISSAFILLPYFHA